MSLEEETEQEASVDRISGTSPAVQDSQSEKPLSAAGSERALSAQSGAAADVVSEKNLVPGSGLSVFALGHRALCGIFFVDVFTALLQNILQCSDIIFDFILQLTGYCAW